MKRYISSARRLKEIPIGTKVYIHSPNSWVAREWGIVNYFDGEEYHVGIAGGEPSLVFTRDELEVMK